MKKCWFFSILLFTTIACSDATDYGTPNIELKDVQADFRKWWSYHQENIILSSNFVAIDESSKRINKADFLKKLTSGDFIPLRLQAKDSLPYYQLYALGKSADQNIKQAIKNTSLLMYRHYKLEGEPFPDFSFKDLKGKAYNNSNTRGKLIILKCWFISCKPCVAEMPELNQLVKQYENRDDIIFLSLAIDSAEDLQRFLDKRNFKYSIVANQQQFMRDSLNVGQFPTHFIINKEGIIEKVVTRYDELALALEGKEQVMKGAAPPPM